MFVNLYEEAKKYLKDKSLDENIVPSINSPKKIDNDKSQENVPITSTMEIFNLLFKKKGK